MRFVFMVILTLTIVAQGAAQKAPHRLEMIPTVSVGGSAFGRTLIDSGGPGLSLKAQYVLQDFVALGGRVGASYWFGERPSFVQILALSVSFRLNTDFWLGVEYKGFPALFFDLGPHEFVVFALPMYGQSFGSTQFEISYGYKL